MRTIALSALLFVLLACGTQAQDPDMRPVSPAQTSRSVAFGALKTRDHKVTWLSGQRLRIEDGRGAVVASGVTLDDLARIDPFLYAACTSAMAQNGAYLDASR